VDLLHGGAGVLHGVKRLLVDVCGFDAVDFALERHDLRTGLFERVFELFFSAQRGFGS
jgi:hypothetical protein